MTLATVFTIAGGIFLACYFSLFFRAVGSLAPIDRDRYNATGSARFVWVSGGLIAGAAFAPGHGVRLAFAVCAGMYVLIEAFIQHRKLQRLAFEPQFLRKQVFIAALGAAGLVAMLGGFVADA